MYMHPSQFGATVQGWKHLSRVKPSFGIERAFQPLLLIEAVFAEHHRHQIAFFDANPVFAGQHAANLYAKPQNILAEPLRLFQFAGCIGVIENQRMQIAVPA